MAREPSTSLFSRSGQPNAETRSKERCARITGGHWDPATQRRVYLAGPLATLSSLIPENGRGGRHERIKLGRRPVSDLEVGNGREVIGGKHPLDLLVPGQVTALDGEWQLRTSGPSENVVDALIDGAR